MNKPVEPTQVTKIHETSNDVDPLYAAQITANMFTPSGNDKYRTIHEIPDDEPVTTGRFNKVFTDWRSYLLEQDERVGTIVAWNWILFIIVFGLLIYLLIKTF